jgi:hypothetical protein
MEFSKEAMLICGGLNEFQLPRAIAHLGTDHFIAWNECFRSLAGYTNEALQLARFKELVVLGEPIGEEGSLRMASDRCWRQRSAFAEAAARQALPPYSGPRAGNYLVDIFVATGFTFASAMLVNFLSAAASSSSVFWRACAIS